MPPKKGTPASATKKGGDKKTPTNTSGKSKKPHADVPEEKGKASHLSRSLTTYPRLSAETIWIVSHIAVVFFLDYLSS